MPRLPQPGGDANNWGVILNEYLQASHKSDGSLKDGVVTGSTVQNGSLTGSKLQDGMITESKLDSGLRGKVNASGGTTNLGSSATASSVVVTSSSGTDATLSAATITNAGVLSSADKTKLNGVTAGATANQSDSHLLNRSNHTGSQAIGTVAGLQSALDGKLSGTHTHVVADTTGLQAALNAKADSTHTHTVANVTGLQGALDGKAASGHTHAYALGDLSNVSTTGAAANQVLKYNGTSWAPATDNVSGGGGGGANLSAIAAPSTVTIDNDSGTDATILSATITNSGVLSAADKVKLNGITTGATANESDAHLLGRANHTGSQAISTVTGLESALTGKASSSHVHALGDLSNVSTAGATTNQVLKYNGTSWAPAADEASGGSATNLGTTTTSGSVVVTNSSGSDATLPVATTTNAGVLSAADKTKLNGVAPSATANDTDANLRNRANHTGAQAIATVTGLESALTGKAAATHNHAAADITSGVIGTARLGTGTANGSNFLRGDGTWAAPTGGGGSTGWNIRKMNTTPVEAASNDWIIANPENGAIYVNLPAPVANARVRVKRARLSGNSIMIIPPSGSMLDGGEPTQATLNGGWSSQDYESDGTDWFVV